MKLDRLVTLDIVILSLVVALLVTLLGGYTFAGGNQVEQLPTIMRAMDSNYLTNDRLIAPTQLDIRFFYSMLVIAVARLVSLPYSFLLLTLVANFALALVTGLFVRDLFDRSNLAAMFAICIVTSIPTFGLGSPGAIYVSELNPNLLALPLGLLSLWAGFRGNPLICALLAGGVSLLHPTFGLETGAVVLAVLVAAMILVPANGGSPRRAGEVLRIAGAIIILGVFAAVWAIPYLSGVGGIEAEQYVKIVAYFRNPHHMVPSTFPRRDYLEAISFLVALGIGWWWWRKANLAPGRLVASIPIFVGIVLLLCLAGYLFVEVFPSPIWVVAQTFRLLFLVKWLGLALVGGTVARFLQQSKDGEADGFLLLVGVLSPLTMGITHVSRLIRTWAQQHLPLIGTYLAFGPTLLLVVFVLVVQDFRLRMLFLFLVFVFVALFLAWCKTKWLSWLLVVAAACLLVVPLFLGPSILPARVDAALEPYRPVITLADLTGDDVDMARYAQENTPEDAIFLTPPLFGQFRVTAQRAIVVDFKRLSTEQVREWQQRLFESYGEPKALGFEAAKEMDDNYKETDDEKLRDLQAKYGISYAVLYRETDTALPLLYENPTYKLVLVPHSPSE